MNFNSSKLFILTTIVIFISAFVILAQQTIVLQNGKDNYNGCTDVTIYTNNAAGYLQNVGPQGKGIDLAVYNFKC